MVIRSALIVEKLEIPGRLACVQGIGIEVLHILEAGEGFDFPGVVWTDICDLRPAPVEPMVNVVAVISEGFRE